MWQFEKKETKSNTLYELVIPEDITPYEVGCLLKQTIAIAYDGKYNASVSIREQTYESLPEQFKRFYVNQHKKCVPEKQLKFQKLLDNEPLPMLMVKGNEELLGVDSCDYNEPLLKTVVATERFNFQPSYVVDSTKFDGSPLSEIYIVVVKSLIEDLVRDNIKVVKLCDIVPFLEFDRNSLCTHLKFRVRGVFDHLT